jgi:hypothetical protein
MEELEVARRHVLEARCIVAEQRQRVHQLSEHGAGRILRVIATACRSLSLAPSPFRSLIFVTMIRF